MLKKTNREKGLLLILALGLILISPYFNNFVKAETIQTSVTIKVCGNETIEGDEVCDDGINNGQYGYCNSECTAEGPYCGDGDIYSAEEQCDGSSLESETCVSLDFYGGTLACEGDCTFDTSSCTGTPPPPPSGGGGGGGGVTVPVTKVIIQGIAYPNASVNILYDGQLASIIKSDSAANFKVEITALSAGTYNFSFWAEDEHGKRSITFSFSVTISSGMTTTISNIFIPPTVGLGKTNVLKGEDLPILGQTAPDSKVIIQVQSEEEITKTTQANEKGEWSYAFDTSPLEEGSHTVRVRAESIGGLLSSFSKILGFGVGKYTVTESCPKADFNKDKRTNLVDFSIMLFWWGKYNPCVDQNQDGIVNLPDFSILMYWWTG